MWDSSDWCYSRGLSDVCVTRTKVICIFLLYWLLVGLFMLRRCLLFCLSSWNRCRFAHAVLNIMNKGWSRIFQFLYVAKLAACRLSFSQLPAPYSENFTIISGAFAYSDGPLVDPPLITSLHELFHAACLLLLCRLTCECLSFILFRVNLFREANMLLICIDFVVMRTRKARTLN